MSYQGDKSAEDLATQLCTHSEGQKARPYALTCFQVWDNPTVMQGEADQPRDFGVTGLLSIQAWRQHFSPNISKSLTSIFFFLVWNRARSRTSHVQVSLWWRKPAHYIMKHFCTLARSHSHLPGDGNFKAKHAWRHSLWVVFWNGNHTSAQFVYVLQLPKWLTMANLFYQLWLMKLPIQFWMAANCKRYSSH